MKCRYSAKDVALYVEGDVTPAKASEIQAHLTVCTECRDLATELRESQTVLKSLRQDTVSTTSLASVRSQVLAEIQAGVKPAWGRWVYALAGTVFVAVITAALATYMQTTEDREIVKSAIPLHSEGGVSTPSSKGSLPSKGDNRLLEPTTPSAPVKVKEPSQHYLKVRSRPSLAKNRNIIAPTEIPAEPAKQTVVKLLTDDPNIVIYWLIDQTGGAL